MTSPAPPPGLDPAALAQHRPALLRYALLQLRQPHWAEDAVSDTLLAALERPQAFQGAAQLRTWLVGILKHKIIDILRHQQRVVQLETDDDGEALDDLLFTAEGHFREAPRTWGDPAARLGERQFIAILEACVELLPRQAGRVFLMREWLELSTDEICKEVGISPTNLWVILHRARLRLRECLQVKGFAAP